MEPGSEQILDVGPPSASLDVDARASANRLRVPAFHYEVVREGAAFAAMREGWARLHDRSDAAIFNAWEWLHPWFVHLGKGVEPFILTAKEASGELVGLLPLCRRERRVFGARVRRLSFLGESYVGSDYLDVIAKAADRPAVTLGFAQFLKQARAEWDLLDLTDVSSDSPTLAIFDSVFSDGYRRERTERFVCPHEVFEPDKSFEQFLAGTVRRDNYLRRRKWLSKQPGHRIERITGPDGLESALDDFFRLHALRWQSDGGSQGIRGPSVERFHRQAASLFAQRGWLKLYTMKIEKEAIASVYGMVHRGTFIYYQSGYDPTWASKSPGLVLVGETFKDAIESGLTEYDFLRGTEGYKFDWTKQVRRTVSLRILPEGGPGKWLTRSEALAKGTRQAIKAVLPARSVEAIRRLRRRITRV